MSVSFMPDAVIFDMDGVLVDSEVQWKKIESEFLEGLIPTWSDADQQRIIGMSIHDVFSMLVQEYGLEISKDDFMGYYGDLAGDIYGNRVSLLPGVEVLLELVREQGFPCAVASSSPRSWIEIVVERFQLAHYFKVVTSGDDVIGKGKPDPAIFLLTAKLLECEPQGCVVIEDSEKGTRAASAAGMFCIGLRNGANDHHDLSAAQHIIDDLGKLRFPITSVS